MSLVTIDVCYVLTFHFLLHVHSLKIQLVPFTFLMERFLCVCVCHSPDVPTKAKGRVLHTSGIYVGCILRNCHAEVVALCVLSLDTLEAGWKWACLSVHLKWCRPDLPRWTDFLEHCYRVRSVACLTDVACSASSQKPRQEHSCNTQPYLQLPSTNPVHPVLACVPPCTVGEEILVGKVAELRKKLN